MKVAIFGDDCTTLQLSILLAKQGHEVVMAPLESEARTNTGDVLITNETNIYWFHCDPNIEIKTIQTFKKDDSYRGGSRGKGGKTKYRRK
jgi:hypothetical protein